MLETLQLDEIDRLGKTRLAFLVRYLSHLQAKANVIDHIICGNNA